jgi:hypothetical protein
LTGILIFIKLGLDKRERIFQGDRRFSTVSQESLAPCVWVVNRTYDIAYLKIANGR